MKRALILPDGNFLAHTTRPFEIARALDKKGYDIAFAGQGPHMQIIEDEGYTYHTLKTIDPNHVMECCLSGRLNFYNVNTIEEIVEDEIRIINEVPTSNVRAIGIIQISGSIDISCIANT